MIRGLALSRFRSPLTGAWIVRVTSAQIDLSAQHALTQNHTRREELAIVVQDNDGTTT